MIVVICRTAGGHKQSCVSNEVKFSKILTAFEPLVPRTISFGFHLLPDFCVVFHPGDHFVFCFVADEWYILNKQRGNNRDVSSTNSKYFWAWLEFCLDISSKIFKDNSKVVSKIVNIHRNFKRMSVNHKTKFVFKINFYSSLDLCLSHFWHQI